MENIDVNRFNQLEQTLEAFQENSRQLSLIAQDFQPKSQEVLNQKLQTLITGMQELNQMKDSFGNIQVPIEVLDFLDKGKNPQLYTKECMERTLAKNKEVKGKTELYKKFRAHLLKELSEEMTYETNMYRSFRETLPIGATGAGSVGDSSEKLESPTTEGPTDP